MGGPEPARLCLRHVRGRPGCAGCLSLPEREADLWPPRPGGTILWKDTPGNGWRHAGTGIPIPVSGRSVPGAAASPLLPGLWAGIPAAAPGTDAPPPVTPFPAAATITEWPLPAAPPAHVSAGTIPAGCVCQEGVRRLPGPVPIPGRPSSSQPIHLSLPIPITAPLSRSVGIQFDGETTFFHKNLLFDNKERRRGEKKRDTTDT